MKIVIASDHAGFSLKNCLVEVLSQQKEITVEDLGPAQEASVDYPDFASKVAEIVSQGHVDAGILICGTGQGMAISANKFKNVRAALISDVYSARMAKEHNNANILILGARIVDPAKAARLMKIWLKSKFQGSRHQKRLDKIAEIEKKNFI